MAATIARRYITNTGAPAGSAGGGFIERIFISDLGAASPVTVNSNLSRVDGALIALNESGTAPQADARSIKASGTLTVVNTQNFADTETVTIDAKTYTFQTALTDVDGNVLIGANADASLANLVAAVTLGAGSGTTYAASTTLHPTVTAAPGAADTMTATAKTGGTAGDSIATTETSAQASWGGATLAGGKDSTAVAISYTSPGDDNKAATLELFGAL